MLKYKKYYFLSYFYLECLNKHKTMVSYISTPERQNICIILLTFILLNIKVMIYIKYCYLSDFYIKYQRYIEYCCLSSFDKIQNMHKILLF